MQHMEVSGAVRPLKWSLGVKWLIGTGVHVMCCYSCQILIGISFYRNIFEKSITFHENPTSGRQVVPCGRTDNNERINNCF